MTEEFKVELSVDEALENFLKEFSLFELESENIKTSDSLSRILHDDIIAPNDIPQKDKALIDGYAANSNDILKADREKPVALKIIGECTIMNSDCMEISPGEAIRVSKGSIMPKNADVVIPEEDTLPEVKKSSKTVKILNNLAAGSNITKQGEDVRAKDVFILKQRKIRPQDIGGIIGIGCNEVSVYKKPFVAIIPTGSELVESNPENDPRKILSSNSYVIKGFVEQLGGDAEIFQIVLDDLSKINKTILKALKTADMVIISGGSSTGEKDFTLRAIEKIENSKIIAQKVAMKPGGHAILAKVGDKPVIGLPGHPVSSMTCFNVFVKPVLRKLSGDPRSFWQIKKDTPFLDAVLIKNIKSPEGKDDFVRVRLKETEDGKILAYPFVGRSSFLSTLVKSHGIIKIPADCSALYEGDSVRVFLF